MKYFILLLFISIKLSAQPIYELCGAEIQKEIRANTSSNISWSVIPLIPYQVNNDVMTITFKDLGTYVITATFSNDACYSNDKIVIKIIECKETFIWIPTAFTPNGDGDNEEFGAYGINIVEFKMAIWNRWGEMVFFSHDLNKRWDGTFNNRICEDDIYTYKMYYKDINNKYHEKIGRVTLIK
jgi:gliding motility-associated-like protein